MGVVEGEAPYESVCYHLYLKACNTKHDKKKQALSASIKKKRRG